MNRIVLRVALSLGAGLLIAFIVSEGSFFLLKRNQDRQPQTIQLTIPAGTAARVAAGENPPSIPADITFIVGDTLEVENLDSANHQLGPLFIPAGSKATLSFDVAQKYAYLCSFRTDKYLGFDVQEAITLKDRIIGVLFAGLPLGMLISVYALFAQPPAKKKEAVA